MHSRLILISLFFVAFGASLLVADEPAKERDQLDRMSRQAILKYRAGDLPGARKIWEEMLAIKPGEKRAATFLEETKAEYEKSAAEGKAREEKLAANAELKKLLDSPVSISTEKPILLSEFMRMLTFSSAKELEYTLAAGTETTVSANFADRPLREVLDAVLSPAGLKWDVERGRAISITAVIQSKVFKLSEDQFARVRSLLDSGDLQRAIWGKPDPPGSGFELNLDERAATLTCSGSKRHIEKTRDFLADLDLPASTGALETRVYKIRAQDGAKIKALVHALLASDESGVPAAERKIFVDGSDLMIRDTPENLAKFEALLTDRKFMGQMKDLKLTIVNFSLVPRDVEQGNLDQRQAFTSRVVEAIETFLYAAEGKKTAAAQGRRLWYDPASMQLTVVDTPDRIAQVGRYLESLPELKHRKQQRVMELDYAKAEDLAEELQEVLQAQKPSSSRATGEETVKKLRRGDEFTFGDIRIRLMRVEPGDPNDRNDDECEINVNTGTQVNNISLRELDTIFFEDYEITAEDVQPALGPNGSNRGEGSVRLRVRAIERSESR